MAIDQLKACAAEGPDGAGLPHCVKVYLPPPVGRHGMVLEISRIAGQLRLLYVAFGVRHPSRDMRQLGIRGLSQLRLQDLAELREHARTPH